MPARRCPQSPKCGAAANFSRFHLRSIVQSENKTCSPVFLEFARFCEETSLVGALSIRNCTWGSNMIIPMGMFDVLHAGAKHGVLGEKTPPAPKKLRETYPWMHVVFAVVRQCRRGKAARQELALTF